MDNDIRKKAVSLINQNLEEDYVELIGNYCIENNFAPEPVNNEIAFGSCTYVPSYMDSKVQHYINQNRPADETKSKG